MTLNFLSASTYDPRLNANVQRFKVVHKMVWKECHTHNLYGSLGCARPDFIVHLSHKRATKCTSHFHLHESEENEYPLVIIQILMSPQRVSLTSHHNTDSPASWKLEPCNISQFFSWSILKLKNGNPCFIPALRFFVLITFWWIRMHSEYTSLTKNHEKKSTLHNSNRNDSHYKLGGYKIMA